MRIRHAWVALLCLCVCAAVVFADTLKLKNGTVLEGKVIEQGDKYWIKLSTGETKIISKSEVASLTKGDAKPSAAPAAKPGAPTTPKPTAGAGVTNTSSSFAAVKAKADRVDAPVQAVALWEKYIATTPPQGDLEAAKAELANWEKLKNDNAERIKGVWVGGVERKRIVKQAKNMVQEGIKQIENGQTQAGFKKMEDALKLYPQSFDANFYLGLHYLKKSTYNERARFDLANLDTAVRTLEMSTKIAPKCSSAYSNLAIGYAFKNRYQDAIKTAYKAATMHESDETVSNLIAVIGYAPPNTREQGWAKPICEAAVAMASNHKIEGKGFYYIPPAPTDEVPGSDNPAGTVWSGSGFFVTSDGYLITNHHVATGDPKTPINPDVGFRVRMDDGTEKPAELIAIDDVADIAVMKIKTDSPVVPLKLATYLPKQASDILVLGYPATGEEEHTLQISAGNVKSVHEGDEHEVWMDLNTTHGNSGGPIVDPANHVIGILTAGRESFNMTIVLGVSGPQIKAFLEKITDKAPKVEWVDKPKDMPAFNAEKLTEDAKVSTVCVIAVRTN